MTSIDSLFFRVYDRDNYNCCHFLADAWQHVTGQDMRQRLQSWLCAASDWKVTRQDMQQFRRLAAPESPCIVLLQNAIGPHVGLFYCGKVLHITEQQGVQYMPLEIVQQGYARVRFYK